MSFEVGQKVRVRCRDTEDLSPIEIEYIKKFYPEFEPEKSMDFVAKIVEVEQTHCGRRKLYFAKQSPNFFCWYAWEHECEIEKTLTRRRL